MLVFIVLLNATNAEVGNYFNICQSRVLIYKEDPAVIDFLFHFHSSHRHAVFNDTQKMKIIKRMNIPDKRSIIFLLQLLDESFSSLTYKLPLWWRRSRSYKNQSIDLQSKSMDWFLCDSDLRHKKIKRLLICCYELHLIYITQNKANNIANGKRIFRSNKYCTCLSFPIYNKTYDRLSKNNMKENNFHKIEKEKDFFKTNVYLPT